jgi:hypothetical protein
MFLYAPADEYPKLTKSYTEIAFLSMEKGEGPGRAQWMWNRAQVHFIRSTKQQACAACGGP